ncbi:MAG: thiamine diphosphokinase [Bacteroidetes bacterium]|nr:thiamine diphosphokinase [Bacteroidota bacterium]MBU1116120.1 thiamine diphosphokinase [Bacteroidota bacterium]MBU1800412.1 thiamine diphosphokinase [Bacteroidota bacterium]
MKSCIIIANGDSPKRGVIKYLQNNGAKSIIAADGGANSAYKLEIVPNYIIGDFDSIKPKVKEYFSDKSEIIYINQQDDTDVEKALKFAIKNHYKTVYLLGGTGDRLDHSICNLGIVLKFYNKIRIIIIHGKTILFPYSTDIKLKTIPNETISLYAFNDKTIITSYGLKYPLKDSTLLFGEKESTSNVAVEDEINLKIKGGIIFVIRELKTMRKNGLIFKS